MSEAAIDVTIFEALRDTAGADFVPELVAAFLEEAPPMLEELRSAREAGAAERFRRAAHSLKSNSQTFGATRLGELARELELTGLGADPATLDTVAAEYARVAGRLRELCGG
jgi:HPt (histidine-containing phosphotransfer) domain-containing protein